MGYTHYWNKPNFTDGEFAELAAFANLIEEIGKTPVSISGNAIVINGPCETFKLEKTHTPDCYGNFCKTRRYDYDKSVVAVLIAAHHVKPDFNWQSDGREHDHETGQMLFDYVLLLSSTR